MDPSIAPATIVKAITASDSAKVDCRAIYVGTGGNLVITSAQGESPVTFKNVPNGALLPVRALYINAATSAADIVALF